MSAEPLRILIVDDSAVVRGVVAKWLGEEPGLFVAGTSRTGLAAVADVVRLRPHVAVLDVEMPDMDGVSALPLLLKAQPDLAVLMASSLTRRNADISLRCLALGAADFIAKPTAEVAQSDYRRDLVAKIRAVGEHARRRARMRTPGAAPEPRPAAPAFGRAPASAAPASAGSSFAAAAPAAKHRAFSVAPVRAIAIGASTGGPQALAALLNAIGPSIGRVPVLVTQHMPAAFTPTLAEHLGAASGRPGREAAHGQPLEPGVIHVAPGGKHLTVALKGGAAFASIDDGPPENFCKPSVDPTFRTAAAAYGSGLLAVMLTGMGSDGAAGVRAVASAGGSVIAQDEATSVVWGMPGAAVATGCCAAVLPLPAIGSRIVRLIAGERA
ncbi:chemotaxis response regulator protein-glutamate methylesterase 1 [Methylopila turkensis]|uniref:Protein-glutamate methylesterase/protein-glutamine glutaminase n=2 Tax=Methylopila turkensis TaxID=1437816 RepID=A0A9W6JMJ9_9HYPH|nr:chemotaxis response regulator protein-glutamate methylesterase [Methylopila turkensis]GLK78590.1 chemotaxis response regulator protein-glutamate methylesterase 1 [Methylopila turkensis]